MSDLGTISFLLRTPGGRRVFFLCLAIGMPLLIGIGLTINWMEDRQSAQGVPNDQGGLYIRARDDGGIDRISPTVLNMIGDYPERIVTDIDVNTDATQTIVSASITAYVKDDWDKVAAHYQSVWNPGQPPHESGSAVETVRGNLQWIVREDTPSPYGPPDPHPDMQRIAYRVFPVRPSDEAP